MNDNTVPPSPLTEIIADRVKQIRADRGESGPDLETRLGLFSEKSRGSTISFVERGRRKFDDVMLLLALAAALEVPPVALMLPADGDELVELIPGRPITAREAYAWLIGAQPYPAEDASAGKSGELGYQIARSKLHQLLPYINEITARVAGIDVDSANIYRVVQGISTKQGKDIR
jgi:transcriptional regulator with XRE-family HTH domain